MSETPAAIALPATIEVDESAGGSICLFATGDDEVLARLAYTLDEARPFADRLALAWNSHAGLLAAIADFLAVWDSWAADDSSVNPLDAIGDSDIAPLRAALVAARPSTPDA